MSRKGKCRDSSIAESLFATLSPELTREHHWHNVPVVTDKQRVFLAYDRRHGQGTRGRLSGSLPNRCRDLRRACIASSIVVVSRPDRRRSANPWRGDLGVSIERVSKFVRHQTTSMTETARPRAGAAAGRRDHHGRTGASGDRAAQQREIGPPTVQSV
jgi:hypothetical protein